MANPLQQNIQTLIRTPMVDSQGLITREWTVFIQAIIQVLAVAQDLQIQNAMNVIEGANVVRSDFLGEVGPVTLTYVTSITGAGTADLTITSKTVTFNTGLETAHT
jgi:hypothetical protein